MSIERSLNAKSLWYKILFLYVDKNLLIGFLVIQALKSASTWKNSWLFGLWLFGKTLIKFILFLYLADSWTYNFLLNLGTSSSIKYTLSSVPKCLIKKSFAEVQEIERHNADGTIQRSIKVEDGSKKVLYDNDAFFYRNLN